MGNTSVRIYLHDIFDARFDDAECRACSQVAQKSDWPEEVAESKAMLREDTVLLAIKVHPSSLHYQPAEGYSGVNGGRRASRAYDYNLSKQHSEEYK